MTTKELHELLGARGWTVGVSEDTGRPLVMRGVCLTTPRESQTVILLHGENDEDWYLALMATRLDGEHALDMLMEAEGCDGFAFVTDEAEAN